MSQLHAPPTRAISAAVRDAYPILQELAYFNTGTYGIIAEPVLAKYLENLVRFERRGMAGDKDLHDLTEESRGKVAARLNAEPNEIALSGNATDGVNFVVAGLEWKPGDEVIISDQEHPAMNFPWRYAVERHGIVVKRYHVEWDPAANVRAVEALITPRTRVVATSHVTSPYGIRLPVRDICALAHARGALAFVDGAQSFAVMPIDVKAIGCDFFSGNGHKWLGAPKGTGFLFARQELMEQLKPGYIGAGATVAYDFESGLVLQPNGKRFEFGTRGFAVHASLGYAFDWFDQIGWENVYQRIEQLATYLKRRLAAIRGVELWTPSEWSRSSGLTTFRVVDHDSHALQERFENDAKVFPRPVGPGKDKIRVSTALFNDEEEIDRLVDCVEQFMRG